MESPRILLCSEWVSTHGNNGTMAEELHSALKTMGASVERTTLQDVIPPGAFDWWLVLDYIEHLPGWISAHALRRDKSRLAYTEGILAAGVDLSIPWLPRGDVPGLSPFCFLPEKERLPEKKRATILVDHDWPPYAGTNKDLTRGILESLSSAGVPHQHLTQRLARVDFLRLLRSCDTFIGTHRESYGCSVLEALFFGVRVLLHPPFVHPNILTLEGCFPFDDPSEIPALLTPLPEANRDHWSKKIGSVEKASVEIVERLKNA